jgi:hypothetical protein
VDPFLIRFRDGNTFQTASKTPEYRLAMDAWNKRADYIADSVDKKVDYKIFADLLAEMIPDMAHDSQNDGFLLEHSDLGIQNMFVDDEFNITCILDWDSLCSTVPLETLITHAPLPARSFIPTDSDEKAFEVGFESAEENIDHRCPLTDILKSSQVRRDFDRLLHKDERIDDCRRFQRLNI